MGICKYNMFSLQTYFHSYIPPKFKIFTQPVNLTEFDIEEEPKWN